MFMFHLNNYACHVWTSNIHVTFQQHHIKTNKNNVMQYMCPKSALGRRTSTYIFQLNSNTTILTSTRISTIHLNWWWVHMKATIPQWYKRPNSMMTVNCKTWTRWFRTGIIVVGKVTIKDTRAQPITIAYIYPPCWLLKNDFIKFNMA